MHPTYHDVTHKVASETETVNNFTVLFLHSFGPLFVLAHKQAYRPQKVTTYGSGSN